MKLLRTRPLDPRQDAEPHPAPAAEGAGHHAAGLPADAHAGRLGPGSAATRKLLLLFTSSGVVPEQWYPTGTETAWTFPAGGITEPLTKHKADMIFFKGLHPRGGRRRRPRALDRRRLDRQLLHQQRRPGGLGRPDHRQEHPQADRLPVFQFGALCFYAGEGDITSKIKNNNPYIIHAGPAQKIASECDPYKVYDKLFAGVNMGGPADAMGGQMAMDKLRAEKRSILDALKGDFADLETKVATRGQDEDRGPPRIAARDRAAAVQRRPEDDRGHPPARRRHRPRPHAPTTRPSSAS